MNKFKEYKRTNVGEMRPVTEEDIQARKLDTELRSKEGTVISISEEDLKNGSPKKGDMIARNPNNYSDQWLVNKNYFEENFELIED